MSLSFMDFLDLVSYKLNLRSDDDLNAILSGNDDAWNTCRFDLVLIDSSRIFHFHSQASYTVVNRRDIRVSTQSCVNNRGHRSEFVVGVG